MSKENKERKGFHLELHRREGNGNYINMVCESEDVTDVLDQFAHMMVFNGFTPSTVRRGFKEWLEEYQFMWEEEYCVEYEIEIEEE